MENTLPPPPIFTPFFRQRPSEKSGQRNTRVVIESISHYIWPVSTREDFTWVVEEQGPQYGLLSIAVG